MNPQRREKGVLRAKNLVKILKLQGYYDDDDEEFMKTDLHRRISTRVPCSCSMCGNERKHHHIKSIQERKQNQKFKELKGLYDYEEAS